VFFLFPFVISHTAHTSPKHNTHSHNPRLPRAFNFFFLLFFFEADQIGIVLLDGSFGWMSVPL